MYRKQEHRYTYKKIDCKKGHIMWTSSEETLCGIQRKKNEYVRTLMKFDADIPLCKKCQAILKGKLKEEYKVHGW